MLEPPNGLSLNASTPRGEADMGLAKLARVASYSAPEFESPSP